MVSSAASAFVDWRYLGKGKGAAAASDVGTSLLAMGKGKKPFHPSTLNPIVLSLALEFQ
jgi:hypothetical protein